MDRTGHLIIYTYKTTPKKHNTKVTRTLMKFNPNAAKWILSEQTKFCNNNASNSQCCQNNEYLHVVLSLKSIDETLRTTSKELQPTDLDEKLQRLEIDNKTLREGQGGHAALVRFPQYFEKSVEERVELNVQDIRIRARINLARDIETLRRDGGNWCEEKTCLQAQLDMYRQKAEVQTKKTELTKEKLAELVQIYEQKIQTLLLELKREIFTFADLSIAAERKTKINEPI
uniref:Uncharacterized protein n=1 Tax=Glossina palpalis gambiensis TaxID=67801 RepID=A0A1B0BAR0_9MUSC